MGTTFYHWDPIDDCVDYESDESGNTLVTYTHEPGQFGPLLSESRQSTPLNTPGWSDLSVGDWSSMGVDGWSDLPLVETQNSWYHFDALGSTTMLTDETGAVTDTFNYDAWGNSVARTGATPTPFQWVGRWGYNLEPTFHSFSVRARWYQSVLANWSSADTFFFPGNRYRYSSPTLLSDPSGQQPPDIARDLALLEAQVKSWSTRGWDFAAAALQQFLIQGSEFDYANPIDMSRFAAKIYSNLGFNNIRRKFFDSKAVEKCIEHQWKGRWPVEIGTHDTYDSPGINIRWQDYTSYLAVFFGWAPELFWAMGGFRFGWNQQTKMEVCCSKGRCLTAAWKVIADPPGMFVAYDDYTFPEEPIRNSAAEYGAGFELQRFQICWRYRMVLRWHETVENVKLWDCGD